MRLKGKVAIVTGAAGGMGAAIAQRFAQEGAVVTATDILEDEGRAIVDGIVRAGGKATFRVLDISSEQNWAALLKDVGAADGTPSVLVNNAGLGTAVPALRETPEQFREVIDVNLMGAYWMAQAAAQVMPPGSSIVNIASLLGLVKSFLPQAAYAASKAGLIGLTRDLNQQWSGRRGIRVNAVAPGYFRSEMTEPLPRDKLDAFIAANASSIADDVDGDPVFMARNDFYLGYTMERAEGIAFANVKDVKKKG